jgi:hypothetical protein
VKSATHIPTGEKVAIKILEKEKIVDVADVERVSREIHILKLIRHPNIIQLYEIIETPKQLFLIMEYMESGELFDHIVKCKKYLPRHPGSPRTRPAPSSSRSSAASSTSTASTSSIAISSPRISSLTTTARFGSSTSAFRIPTGKVRCILPR